MKKTFTRTIIVLIIVNLITAGFAFAQNVSDEAHVSDEALKEEALAVRKEADAVQKEADAVQKEADAVRKEADAVRKEASIANIRMPVWQQSHSGGVLVIPSAEMKVENLAAISEDMSVMSRIFDKKVSQSNVQTVIRGRTIVNVNPFLGRGNRATEAIFLEGYGALFLMEINILLSAPPETQQKEKTKEDTDPVWSQMRREIYEPKEVRRSRTDDRQKEKYDAEKVETLKTNLIKTLKHATNIQTLKPEQLVILTVIGDRHRSAATVTRSYSYSGSTGSRSRRIVQTAPEVETGPLPPTVLTICAKKSDIDAFANGELDYDQFRQRTGIFKSYAKAGQNNSPGANEHQVAHEEHTTF